MAGKSAYASLPWARSKITLLVQQVTTGRPNDHIDPGRCQRIQEYYIDVIVAIRERIHQGSAFVILRVLFGHFLSDEKVIRRQAAPLFEALC